MRHFRRVLATLLVVLATLMAALGWQSLASATSSVAEDGPSVLPLLSPRRVPVLAGDLSQEVILRDSARKILGAIPSNTACVSVQRNGRPVFADNVNTPYIPASTAKLLTATAALNVFGAEKKFKTTVVSQDKPKDGVVSGSLFLVGGGDPLLMTNDYVDASNGHRDLHTSLEELADRVVSSGVKTIRGGVVGDDTRFDKTRSLASWEPGYVTSKVVGPIGALSVNQGFVSSATSVWSADVNSDKAAAAIFTQLLTARGVTVTLPATSGTAPDGGNTLGELDSLSMSDIIKEMLTESDNTTAEIMTKNLGVEKSKNGSFETGAKTIVATLRQMGLPTGDIKLVDGSGLDRSNRVTCNLLASILATNGVDGVLANDLAKAGESGTLATRFLNTAAVGRIEAKTGTLSGVSALAGWAKPDGQQPLNFVIITNGVQAEASRSIEDRLALLFATQPPNGSGEAFARS